jgi:hypothetical protein
MDGRTVYWKISEVIRELLVTKGLIKAYPGVNFEEML